MMVGCAVLAVPGITDAYKQLMELCDLPAARASNEQVCFVVVVAHLFTALAGTTCFIS